jgi:hypothetical protein
LTQENDITKNLLGGGTAVPGIKSFLYLDEYKMYSISSQIFEGMTESWVNIRGTSTEEEERQAGPFASGRVIIDPVAVYREF